MNTTGSIELSDQRVSEKAKLRSVSRDVQLNSALANGMLFISIGKVRTHVAQLLEMMTVLAHHDAAPYFDRYPPAFIAASGSITQRGVILLGLRAAPELSKNVTTDVTHHDSNLSFGGCDPSS